MKNILIVETGRPAPSGAFGGSIKSIFQLIEKIDKSKFRLFYYSKYNIEVANLKLESYNIINLTNKDSISHIKRFSFKKYIPDFFKKSIIYNYLYFLNNNNFVKRLIKLIDENQIDIVHGNDRFTANIHVIKSAKLLGVRYIQHQRKFEDKIPFYYHKYLNYPTEYIAISQAIKSNLKSRLRIGENKIKLIHNWINLDLNKNSHTNIKSKHSLNILWMGRIIPWKGIDLLIDFSNELIKRKKMNFKFQIYGDFMDKKYQIKIFKTISKHKLNNYFIFNGFDSLKNIFSENYFCLIHTSKQPEPFGRTIIESMKHKIPVIATNAGGVPDIIKDNYNGFLYDPENIEQLIKKINLLANTTIRTKIEKNAYETIIKKFAGKSQVKQFEEIYNSGKTNT